MSTLIGVGVALVWAVSLLLGVWYELSAPRKPARAIRAAARWCYATLALDAMLGCVVTTLWGPDTFLGNALISFLLTGPVAFGIFYGRLLRRLFSRDRRNYRRSLRRFRRLVRRHRRIDRSHVRARDAFVESALHELETGIQFPGRHRSRHGDGD